MTGTTQQGTVRLATPLERLSVGRHSGPGLRIIFWVQGCSLLCTKTCLNPHLLSQQGGYVVAASDLTETILRLARDYSAIEGLTILGGEPFDQAVALAEAVGPAKFAGLSLMVYTGHTIEALRASNDPGAARLLQNCDVLVDGPFIDELYDEELVWRGSKNQRILRVSDRYSEGEIERAKSEQARGMALSAGAHGDAVISGAQNPDTARQARAVMLSFAMPRGGLIRMNTGRRLFAETEFET
jgi:anaerobic ribonucleoside-triphosphate reductase activating protein